MTSDQSQQPIQLDEWITPREAAELIDVTPHQVRHLARNGIVKARKFGRAWMIHRASAEAYAETDRRPGPKMGRQS